MNTLPFKIVAGLLAATVLALGALTAVHPTRVQAFMSSVVADVVPTPAPSATPSPSPTGDVGTAAVATPPPDATAPDASVAPATPAVQAPVPTAAPTPPPAPLTGLSCSVSIAPGSAQVAVGETAYFSAATSDGTAPFDYYVGGAPVGVRDWGGEGPAWSHGLGVFRAGSYAVTVTVTDATGRTGTCGAGGLTVAATTAPAAMPPVVAPPTPAPTAAPTPAPTPASGARTA
jgi:hypothetical protein